MYKLVISLIKSYLVKTNLTKLDQARLS